jgi:hypothetical protein
MTNRVVALCLPSWESIPGLLKRFTNTGSVQKPYSRSVPIAPLNCSTVPAPCWYFLNNLWALGTGPPGYKRIYLSKERRKTNLFVPYYLRNEVKPKLLFLNHQRNEEKLMHSSLYYQRDEEKWIYLFLNYRRNEDKPMYLFLNHRRNEEKLIHSSLNYQRDEQKRIYLFLNYRRNEDKPKYLFLNYRRIENKAKYSFLNYRWFDIATDKFSILCYVHDLWMRMVYSIFCLMYMKCACVWAVSCSDF